VKIQFIFIIDPVHFISLVAKLPHRAAMNKFSSDLFFCFLGQQAASIVARWKPSCYDEMLNFFTFWAFSCLWHLGSCLDAFLCFCRFLSYLGLSGHFTTYNNTKNTIENFVIKVSIRKNKLMVRDF
jgi:hypothetical protein